MRDNISWNFSFFLCKQLGLGRAVRMAGTPPAPPYLTSLEVVGGNIMSFSEQVKKQLTKCCKKRQPVLLHGEDHVGRLDLVQEVHKENVDVIDLPDSEIFIKEIGKQLSKAVYDELDKRLVAQSTDMPEGILGDAKVLGELDILRIEIDAWDKARNFRIQEGSFMTESELNATNYNAAVALQGADILDTKLWWDAN